MADRRADLLAALFLIWLSTRGGPAVNTAAFNVAADAARGLPRPAGVNPAMLVARGCGDTKPVASSDTEEGRFRPSPPFVGDHVLTIAKAVAGSRSDDVLVSLEDRR